MLCISTTCNVYWLQNAPNVTIFLRHPKMSFIFINASLTCSLLPAKIPVAYSLLTQHNLVMIFHIGKNVLNMPFPLQNTP